jgi:hypothetical protein
MMTSTSRIELSSSFPGMASRSAGDEALLEARRMLGELESIELDFQGQNPSPSFADQFVGGLVAAMGLQEFKRRVRLHNVPTASQALLRHVITRKASLG